MRGTQVRSGYVGPVLRARAPVLVVVVSVALALTGACGGGGSGGGDTQQPIVHGELTSSVATLDGWARTDNTYSAFGTFPPYAGDADAEVPGVQSSAYYSFDLVALPAGAVIQGAVVRAWVKSSVGDPQGQHGGLVAHYFPYGGDLANVLTTVVVGPPPPSAFTPADTTAGEKEADVTELLRRAVQQGLTRLQVRVGLGGTFTIDNGASDYVNLTDGENFGGSGGLAPTLTYGWREP